MKYVVNWPFMVLVFQINFLLSPDVVAHNPASAEVKFSIIGDMPYSAHETALLTSPNGDIYRGLQQQKPSVVIHLGDLKSGGVACTDELLLNTRELLFNLYPHRLIYTPGDNDWTDCDRESLLPSFDELERLSFLKEHFFAGEGLALKSKIAGVTHQKHMVENLRWQIDDLLFTTLHIPGTNNGRTHILESDINQALKAADERDKYNALWLAQTFELAEEAAGLVIAFQADIYRPQKKSNLPACDITRQKNCDSYQAVRKQIYQLAAQYQKPVLVAHGDTHVYCFGAMPNQLGTNLWHLNALGDYSISDVATVIFNAKNSANPFTVKSMLADEPLPSQCYFK